MNLLYSIIIHLFWFLATYFVVLYILLLLTTKKRLFTHQHTTLRALPKVSFVISAFNEEKKIARTIKSLRGLNYPKDKYEIVVINDGSKDGTAKVVNRYLPDPQITFIDNKNNKGKAACLNEGIAKATGTYVVCMDADSIAEKNILRKALPLFADKNVGAVTVAVRVMNNKKLLTKLVELEYLLGLSLLLRVYSFFNAVYVTPGPFSIYRRSVVRRIGGFDTTNITEDHEIALRIIKAGYTIKNTMNAAVYTESPDRFKSLYVQRKRWYSGSLSTFLQHRNMMFKKRYGLIGFLLPFNYFLILVGLFMMGTTLYLTISNLVKQIEHLALTNFNLFEHFKMGFDIYQYGQVDMLTTFSIGGTFLILFLGLRFSNVRIRSKLKAVVLYPFLFLMYQVFWTSAYLSLLLKRKVKWR